MLWAGLMEAAVIEQRRALKGGGPICMSPQRYVAQMLSLGMPVCSPGEVGAWAAAVETAASGAPMMLAPALADLRARLLERPGRNDVDDALYDWVVGVSTFLPYSQRLAEVTRPLWMNGVPRDVWTHAPAGAPVPAGTRILLTGVLAGKDVGDTAAVGAAAAQAVGVITPPGTELLFHGTDWAGAAALLQHGVSVDPNALVLQRGVLDLSFGFCMTPSFAMARRFSCGSLGAVVVFARDRSLERALSTVHPHAGAMPAAGGALTEWQEMVAATYTRQPNVAAAIAGQSPVLTGPICGNVWSLMTIQPPPPPEACEGSEQVVVKTPAAAAAYTARKVGVVFMVRTAAPQSWVPR